MTTKWYFCSRTASLKWRKAIMSGWKTLLWCIPFNTHDLGGYWLCSAPGFQSLLHWLVGRSRILLNRTRSIELAQSNLLIMRLAVLLHTIVESDWRSVCFSNSTCNEGQLFVVSVFDFLHCTARKKNPYTTGRSARRAGQCQSPWPSVKQAVKWVWPHTSRCTINSLNTLAETANTTTHT